MITPGCCVNDNRNVKITKNDLDKLYDFELLNK
jgi:hypothetical protein